jgi:hypothetical protein
MFIQLLLFVMAISLVAIFWELSKINSRLKKTLLTEKEQAQSVEREKKYKTERFEARTENPV